jgi:hypothetical protein
LLSWPAAAAHNGYLAGQAGIILGPLHRVFSRWRPATIAMRLPGEKAGYSPGELEPRNCMLTAIPRMAGDRDRVGAFPPFMHDCG